MSARCRYGFLQVGYRIGRQPRGVSSLLSFPYKTPCTAFTANSMFKLSHPWVFVCLFFIISAVSTLVIFWAFSLRYTDLDFTQVHAKISQVLWLLYCRKICNNFLPAEMMSEARLQAPLFTQKYSISPEPQRRETFQQSPSD